MGCDMHIILEVKLNGKWTLFSQCDAERDYGMFSRVANVRNGYWDESRNEYSYITPITEPNGHPEDMSDLTKKIMEYWNCDAHSQTTYTREMLKKLFDRSIPILWNTGEHVQRENKDWHPTPDEFFGTYMGYSFVDDCKDALEYPCSLFHYEDARAIIWFDN